MTARIDRDDFGLVTDPDELKRRIIEHAERIRTAEGILADVAQHDDETIIEAAQFCLVHTRDPIVLARARGLYARLAGKGIEA